MIEGQLGGVEERTGQPEGRSTVAVDGVADERVPDAGEVHPDLVGPSGLQPAAQPGRTHQIRVHLTAVGHPLVGDPVYGDRRTTLGLTRPFLHASELSFDHPVTGARLTFTSPLPDDLADFLARLERAPTER